MKNRVLVLCLLCLVIGCISLTGCQKKWTETEKGNIRIVTNEGGQILGYSTSSGISLITSYGYAFKDLNKNGRLDVYEDWRKPVEERAKDLASKMTVEQIAGLML